MRWNRMESRRPTANIGHRELGQTERTTETLQPCSIRLPQGTAGTTRTFRNIESRSMISKHTFQIHAKCPLVKHEQWDYYTVTVQTEDMIDVHWIESVMNSVRGMRSTQEEIAHIIKQQLSCEVMVEVTGRHSQKYSRFLGQL